MDGEGCGGARWKTGRAARSQGRLPPRAAATAAAAAAAAGEDCSRTVVAGLHLGQLWIASLAPGPPDPLIAEHGPWGIRFKVIESTASIGPTADALQTNFGFEFEYAKCDSAMGAINTGNWRPRAGCRPP